MLNETPLKLSVGEYTIYIPDAPSSGPVLALILNVVDGESHIVPVYVLASRISPIHLNDRPPEFFLSRNVM